MWYPKCDSPLSYSACYVQFKKLLALVGLDPREFALHSLRIGATTDAFQNKVPKRFIDRQGRWKNKKSKLRYARDSMDEFASALTVKKY